jgi:hypothetical protein
MLETILKLYSMYMATGVTSPLPHLFGPPGCGKSSVVEEAADIIGKKLHIINVSRISPLELEGVQMPVPGDSEEIMKLKLLTATFWTQLNEGDILLLDEFLRAFPEVYNGLLDIITSRQVGGFKLPNVFIIAASNSTVAYDKALEDRLLHLPVPDPRKSNSRAKKDLAEIFVTQLGLLPEMVDSYEMQTMLDTEVLPMYDVLDNLKSGSTSPIGVKGRSLRNLIGQTQLRQVQSPAIKELISMNNQRAMAAGKVQYIFLLDGKNSTVPNLYEPKAQQLKGNDRLTPVQALNLELNLQLIELEKIRQEKGTEEDDILDELASEAF